MGLSAGGLIRGGALQDRMTISLIKENLYLKSYLSGTKIGIDEFVWEGLCAGGGGLIRGVTQVLRKRWAYPLMGGEIRYFVFY